MVVQDLAINPVRCKTKSAHETEKNLCKILGNVASTKSTVQTDNSMEFGKACEVLSWNHAERAVRRVKEGTSAVLLQSGLDEKCFAESMECFCYLRSVHDLLGDGKTPCERRSEEPVKGPVIPFGAMVENHPISPKDQSRVHQFRNKVLPGIFLGCALIAGGICKGDILIADIEELEKTDASDMYPRRINAKEMLIRQKKMMNSSSQLQKVQQNCQE